MTEPAQAFRPIVVAALPTAFDEHEGLDLDAQVLLARGLAREGCDALFVGGTTGEYPALSVRERVSSVQAIVEAVGANRVIAHVGSACARDSEWLAGQVTALGVRDVAAASPLFLPADDDQHFDYFRRISDAAGEARLWLYIFPERTGNGISADLLPRLLDLPNCYAAKVSSPGAKPVAALLEQAGDRLRVLSGSDPDLVDVFAAGGSGLVSGNCAVLPAVYVAFARAVEAGDDALVTALQQQICQVHKIVGGGPGGIKAALRALGRPIGSPRMAVSDAVRPELAEFIARIQAGDTGSGSALVP